MDLKVVVLVKQVPDHEALIRVESEDRLDIENRYVCSFFDEIAIEAALAVRAAHPGTELIALSAGGRRAVDALRRAMAMGIDRLEQLGDDSLESLDSLGVAEVLASRLRKIEPHLVLCGKQAGDDDMAAAGPMVAELLDIPHVSGIVSLEIDPPARIARVEREVEGEIWSLEGLLPLLATADKGLAEPHIPLVTRVMKAMRASIANVPLADLAPAPANATERVRRLRFRRPPSRPAVKMMTEPFPENVAELVKHLEQIGLLS